MKDVLTESQRKVALLVAKGLPNKLIAYELGISEPSVKQYVFNACKKLRMKNRVELAMWVDKYVLLG